MEQNSYVFENMPVPKAVAKNAVPAIISMVVVLIYNIADTFFVGQTGDALQVAAVSLTTPVFLFFMATGNLFGIGGTSVISRALGEKKADYAKKASSFCFYASILTGILFMLLFWCGMDTVLKWIGCSSDTMDYARSYLNCVTLSAPFVIVSNAFSNIVRAEGKSNEAMCGVMVGTVVNIILDPIMITGMHMGVFGAALATVIGNIAGALYYIIYFLRNKSSLSISPRDFCIKNKIMTGVLAIGIPACLNNVLMSASNIVMNNFLATYGDIEVAAMGVAMKVVMIVVLLQVGLGQGVQPLLGFNYGAGNYKRAHAVMVFSFLCAILLGVYTTAFCYLQSGNIVRAFIDNEEVYSYGVSFVRALILSGPVIGILFLFTNALQALGAAVPSLILSISRQGLIFLPLLAVLNSLAGLSGIVYAQPAADILSILLSVILYLRQIKKLRPTENLYASVSPEY